MNEDFDEFQQSAKIAINQQLLSSTVRLRPVHTQAQQLQCYDLDDRTPSLSLSRSESINTGRARGLTAIDRVNHSVRITIIEGKGLPLQKAGLVLYVVGARSKRKVGELNAVDCHQEGHIRWGHTFEIDQLDLREDYYITVLLLSGKLRAYWGRSYISLWELFEGPVTRSNPILNIGARRIGGKIYFQMESDSMDHIDTSFSPLFSRCINELGFNSHILNIAGSPLPFPGPEEIIEYHCDSVGVQLGGHISTAAVFVTNCRILLVSLQTLAALDDILDEDYKLPDMSSDLEQYADLVHCKPLMDGDVNLSVPLGNIIYIENETGDLVTGRITSILKIETQSFLSLRLVFSGSSKRILKSLTKCLMKRIDYEIELKGTFPFNYNYVSSIRQSIMQYGWEKFDMDEEMKRQCVSDLWARSQLNLKYDLCDSYPRILYFPAALSDVILQDCASFRSRQRLPALTYYDKRSGGCICRCAQPMAGLSFRHSEEDQKVLEEIYNACNATDKLTIFDARSKLAAGGNRFKGKGTENIDNYNNVRLLFMDIENIHSMRESIDALREICTELDDESQWMVRLNQCQWLRHVCQVLFAATQVAIYTRQRRAATLVHCSDGWDRTSQLCALAQLMLDPFYRTAQGFQILIEKDFLAFGHKFSDRLGDVHKPSERSPVFLQFLDCTYQLMLQFPESFEFSEMYLVAIAEHMFSGWFGNFMYNTNHERRQEHLRLRGVSIWAYLDAFVKDPKALNPRFDPDGEEFIIPVASMKLMGIWKSFYLRYDSSSFAPTVLDDYDEMSDILERRSIPLDTGAGGFLDFKSNVFFVSNRSAKVCKECKSSFGLLSRKNHCRLWYFNFSMDY